MAVNTLGRLVRFRRVSQADLLAGETGVLKAGEPVYVTESGEIRVGDGTSSVLNLPSSRNRTVRTVTASHTLTRADDVVFVNAAGATTATLPAANVNSGRQYTIKNIGAGTVTIAITGGGNIDGAGPGTLAQYALLRVVSNGTQWYTI